MTKILANVVIFASLFLVAYQFPQGANIHNPLIPNFRPPAVPLIVFDPYISIWSFADNLYDVHTTNWCGTKKAMIGIIRIDGTSYRFMGPFPSNPVLATISQISVRVQPTQTFYTFQNDLVTLEVIFSTPTIPTDLDTLSQPVSYITYNIESNDGKQHEVQLYFDMTAEITVNKVDEEVKWSRVNNTENQPEYILSFGTTAQNTLGQSGDCIGINWGYAYIAVTPQNENDDVTTVFAKADTSRAQFVLTGTIPKSDDTNQPRRVNDGWPVIAVAWNFEVSSKQNQTRWIIFGYDDIMSILYFGNPMPAYWKRNGQTAVQMLTNASQTYQLRLNLLNELDNNVMNELYDAANAEYATLASLAYRQTFGACKLVWNANAQVPWYFMKEISSDGDLSTMDVIFPASPLILYQNPYLLQLLMLPLLAYANNETNTPYNLTWAPHDLGTYPIANRGPMDQEQMPVEETGNLLLMISSLVNYEAQTNKEYANLIYPQYESLIDSYAAYLISGPGVLPNPEDQLCTDDFLGPIPQNVNLALKGISALSTYIIMCNIQGRTQIAKEYTSYTENYEAYWMSDGYNGNHSRLQYNVEKTWSLKYNLLYQYIVGATLFPPSVMVGEVNWYMNSNLNKYGINLDSNVTFTKLDWQSWIAAMSPSPNLRLQLFNILYNFANETPQRVPLTDWYDTAKGTQQGFQARPVVGGLYAWMLINAGQSDSFNFVSTFMNTSSDINI